MMVMLPQRTHFIDPALAKRRPTSTMSVRLSTSTGNVSCSPELNNIAGVCKREILKATVGSMLGQRVRRWRSTEAADYNITPDGNIMYIFSVINIYDLEPAAPNTHK